MSSTETVIDLGERWDAREPPPRPLRLPRRAWLLVAVVAATLLAGSVPPAQPALTRAVPPGSG